jgi:hypothetical protein
MGQSKELIAKKKKVGLLRHLQLINKELEGFFLGEKGPK